MNPELLFTRAEIETVVSSIEGALRVLDELMLQTATLESGPGAYLSLQQQIVELTQSHDALRAKLDAS